MRHYYHYLLLFLTFGGSSSSDNVSIQCERNIYKLQPNIRTIQSVISIVIKEKSQFKPVQTYTVTIDTCAIKEDRLDKFLNETSFVRRELPIGRGVTSDDISAILLDDGRLPQSEMKNMKMDYISGFISSELHTTSEGYKYIGQTLLVNILYISEYHPSEMKCAVFRNAKNWNEIGVNCEVIPNVIEQITFEGSFEFLSDKGNRNITSSMVKKLRDAVSDIDELSFIVAYDQKLPVLYNNSISDFNLNALILERCDIEHIFPRAFQNLVIKNLNLENNRIDILRSEIFENCSFVWLKLKFNQIHTIESNALDGLSVYHIDLSNNNIQEIDSRLWRAQGVHNLYLSHNEIRVVPERALDGLSSVKLDFNQIHTLESRAFKFIQRTGIINLRQNFLTSLNTGDFENLSVSDLILSHNKISHVQKEAFSHSSFHEMDLSYNKLSKIFRPMFSNTSINTLRLISNGVHDIEPGTFKEIGDLVVLDLDDNELTVLKTGSIGGNLLETVHLLKNNITKIEPNAVDACEVNLITVNVNELDDESRYNLGQSCSDVNIKSIW